MRSKKDHVLHRTAILQSVDKQSYRYSQAYKNFPDQDKNIVIKTFY